MTEIVSEIVGIRPASVGSPGRYGSSGDGQIEGLEVALGLGERLDLRHLRFRPRDLRAMIPPPAAAGQHGERDHGRDERGANATAATPARSPRRRS